jgi:hypothetical protein
MLVYISDFNSRRIFVWVKRENQAADQKAKKAVADLFSVLSVAN